jgi:hypothetical protein
LTGEKVPSVTTTIKAGIPIPRLAGWAAREAAEYAVSEWDALGEMPPLERIDDIKNAHSRKSEAAANKGDIVHEVIDHWATGKPNDPPKEVAGYVSSFVNFMTEVRPVFVENEVCLWSRKHGYAGTADWIAEINGVTTLGDTKSGRGIYPEAAMQVSALAHADFILRDDGTEEPLPRISQLMVLQVRPRSWHLFEVTAAESAFKAFLAARAIWEWTNEIADHALKMII